MAFCRIDDAPIRTHDPVSEPDVLVIQDATLLHQIAVFAGLLDGALACDPASRRTGPGAAVPSCRRWRRS